MSFKVTFSASDGDSALRKTTVSKRIYGSEAITGKLSKKRVGPAGVKDQIKATLSKHGENRGPGGTD
jgi:hypothetical protein